MYTICVSVWGEIHQYTKQTYQIFWKVVYQPVFLTVLHRFIHLLKYLHQMWQWVPELGPVFVINIWTPAAILNPLDGPKCHLGMVSPIFWYNVSRLSRYQHQTQHEGSQSRTGGSHHCLEAGCLFLNQDGGPVCDFGVTFFGIGLAAAKYIVAKHSMRVHKVCGDLHRYLNSRCHFDSRLKHDLGMTLTNFWCNRSKLSSCTIYATNSWAATSTFYSNIQSIMHMHF